MWYMKDGSEIPLFLMSDSHLKNALKMVERKYPPPYPMTAPDSMADYFAEQDYDSACQCMADTMNDLRLELERRGINEE